MKLSLDLKATLSQTLTPQQIQYLKLLQLPLIQLEQQVFQEIEQNPMLEEYDPEATTEYDIQTEQEPIPLDELHDTSEIAEPEINPREQIDDQGDPFEFYRMLWQDDSQFKHKNLNLTEDDDNDDFFQIKDVITLAEELLQQLRMLHLSKEEILLGEQIIGNVDNDGYFRSDLSEIVEEANKRIDDLNFEIVEHYEKLQEDSNADKTENPARQFAVSDEALKISQLLSGDGGPENGNNKKSMIQKEIEEILYKHVNLEQAEKVLKQIQLLDPPGFASRTVQECLISQCKTIPKLNAAQKLALEILENAYEPFTMKHYHLIIKQLNVTEEYLKEAIDVIRRLNPKPGGLDTSHLVNTVIPDFTVTRDEETNELLISVNDNRLPILRLNKAYEKLKKEARLKVFNKETREWIRNKYEDAKFLIQAIHQRKNTMLKVMTAIAHLQKDYFYLGASALKPLIYKDVAEVTGLDISTICRIVNGKYVQTDFGTHELKFFFSESLPSEDGQEVSTRVVKNIIKDIIAEEPKNKPYSDEKIGNLLKEKGFQIARRTVAKYREQMKIPVARLRKEL